MKLKFEKRRFKKKIEIEFLKTVQVFHLDPVRWPSDMDGGG